MSDVTYLGQSGTFSAGRAGAIGSAVVAFGLLAGGVPAGFDAPQYDELRIEPSIPQEERTSSSRAFSYEAAPIGRFEESMGRVYARLQRGQEPLGAEFERVLVENLWELYSSE